MVRLHNPTSKSKRQTALNGIMYAGYHNDQQTYARLYVENRISYPVAREWYGKGIKAREKGIPCGCLYCKRG